MGESCTGEKEDIQNIDFVCFMIQLVLLSFLGIKHVCWHKCCFDLFAVYFFYLAGMTRQQLGFMSVSVAPSAGFILE